MEFGIVFFFPVPPEVHYKTKFEFLAGGGHTSCARVWYCLFSCSFDRFGLSLNPAKTYSVHNRMCVLKSQKKGEEGSVTGGRLSLKIKVNVLTGYLLLVVGV